jgi:hypothetical protein
MGVKLEWYWRRRKLCQTSEFGAIFFGFGMRILRM